MSKFAEQMRTAQFHIRRLKPLAKFRIEGADDYLSYWEDVARSLAARLIGGHS